MLPIQKRISPYNNSSRNGNSIKYIILHYTGNASDTAAGNANYFNSGNKNASAHLFVDNNSIFQVVEFSRAAWSVGDGKGIYGITNQNSISIEMCCSGSYIISEKTENNAIELTRYLMDKFNIPLSNVVRHYDASRKICPNWSANNWSRWINFKKKLGDNTIINIPIATNPSEPIKDPVQEAKEYVGDRCKELQEKLIKLGYDCGGYGADGVFGQGTYDSVIKFQKDNGLVADGLVGEKTWAKIDEKINELNKKNISSSWVARLQAECNKQGFSNQKVDGIPGPATLDGCPTLKYRSKGNITKLLQERLNSLGYNTNGIDGIFGNGTKNAVIKYQSNKGLSADGVVGKNTWRKLLGL